MYMPFSGMFSGDVSMYSGNSSSTCWLVRPRTRPGSSPRMFRICSVYSDDVSSRFCRRCSSACPSTVWCATCTRSSAGCSTSDTENGLYISTRSLFTRITESAWAPLSSWKNSASPRSPACVPCRRISMLRSDSMVMFSLLTALDLRSTAPSPDTRNSSSSPLAVRIMTLPLSALSEAVPGVITTEPALPSSLVAAPPEIRTAPPAGPPPPAVKSTLPPSPPPAPPADSEIVPVAPSESLVLNVMPPEFPGASPVLSVRDPLAPAVAGGVLIKMLPLLLRSPLTPLVTVTPPPVAEALVPAVAMMLPPVSTPPFPAVRRTPPAVNPALPPVMVMPPAPAPLPVCNVIAPDDSASPVDMAMSPEVGAVLRAEPVVTATEPVGALPLDGPATRLIVPPVTPA